MRLKESWNNQNNLNLELNTIKIVANAIESVRDAVYVPVVAVFVEEEVH